MKKPIIGLFVVLSCVLVMTAGCGKKFVRSASDAADLSSDDASRQVPSAVHEVAGDTRNGSLTPLADPLWMGDPSHVVLNSEEAEGRGPAGFSEAHESVAEAGPAGGGTPGESRQGDSSLPEPSSSSTHASFSSEAGPSRTMKNAGNQTVASRQSFSDFGDDSSDDFGNVTDHQAAPKKGVSFSHGLQDVLFAFASWRLSEEARRVLESNAEWLKAHRHERLTIEGHCDERGTQAYNYVLGEKRAAMVKQYLSFLGVPSHQMVVTSFGKDRPTCRLFTEACFRVNRRAHFVPEVQVAVR